MRRAVPRCVECNSAHEVKAGKCEACRHYAARTESAATLPAPVLPGQVECCKCGGGANENEMVMMPMGLYCPACIQQVGRMWA